MKTEGGHGEAGAIALVSAHRAFQGKSVGPGCFIANASVTSKATCRTSIIGFAPLWLTSDLEEASEAAGKGAPRECR